MRGIQKYGCKLLSWHSYRLECCIANPWSRGDIFEKTSIIAWSRNPCIRMSLIDLIQWSQQNSIKIMAYLVSRFEIISYIWTTFGRHLDEMRRTCGFRIQSLCHSAFSRFACPSTAFAIVRLMQMHLSSPSALLSYRPVPFSFLIFEKLYKITNQWHCSPDLWRMAFASINISF
jgi:hypothetical protein